MSLAEELKKPENSFEPKDRIVFKLELFCILIQLEI
jgi:hypothetical protein